MDRAHLYAASPHFLVSDVLATARYYRDTLGFQLDGTAGEPPVFAMVVRDGVSLYFSQAALGKPGGVSNRGGSSVAYDAYIHLRGVDALAQELVKRGADVVEGVVVRPYGHREVVVRDLNGLHLCFGEPPQ